MAVCVSIIAKDVSFCDIQTRYLRVFYWSSFSLTIGSCGELFESISAIVFFVVFEEFLLPEIF